MNIQKLNAKNPVAIALALLAATGITLLANPSQAAPPAADVPRVVVKYADLDLKTPAGVAVLYGRLQTAATTVCGNVDSADLTRKVPVHACRKRAVAEAVASMDNPLLTHEYAVRTGNAPKDIATASLR